MKPQTWIITGASGMIGTALTHSLLQKGATVRTLGRSDARTHPDATAYAWDLEQGIFPSAALEDVDVVVHLAGANVGQRWTRSHKLAIMESRTKGTSLLCKALKQMRFTGAFIQASAVGYYGDCTSAVDENGTLGQGFLAQVAEAWEQSAAVHLPSSTRHVVMRLGIVLSPNGGTLDRLLPIYRLGLGAPLGKGSQCMSWIHVEDVVRFVQHAATTATAHGAFNLVAPERVPNAQFSRVLAKCLGRPHFAPSVPAWALRLVLGEMATIVLESQNVVPDKLLKEGFQWRHPALKEALLDCI